MTRFLFCAEHDVGANIIYSLVIHLYATHDDWHNDIDRDYF